MKTSPVTADDLARSVIAVPPLARHADLTIDRSANETLVRHLEAGGVSTLLYGGNANFYNLGMHEYGAVLDTLAEIAAAATWVIPSAGPDFGKLMDQAPALKARGFPTAMVLPLRFPATVSGVEAGIRRFADAFGRPVIVYLKDEPYLTPEAVRRLVDAGAVAGIKYAIVRDDPRRDDYLRELCALVDRRLVVSGMGERPAVVHLRDFGLGGFTSGSVCVGPRGSTALLAAARRGDWPAAETLRARYLPLEDLRDAHSPIRVLHEAVTLAKIADMGPMLPLLSNVETDVAARIAPVAAALAAWDRGVIPASMSGRMGA